jgi:hypothetical protein
MDWRSRGVGILFAALALLQLVPVWSVRYLPTGDGACHVYNAWILRGLALGRASAGIAAHYQIDWRLNPNWISHAFLALALSFVSPSVAEKLLFSLILLVFLGGAWLFARANDSGNGIYAFLAFPLAFHWLLMCGFYNFALSVGLYMIVVAFWWRRRDDPSASTIVAVALLLLLCYFAHPMSAALAIGSIGILWSALLRGRPLRRHALHLLTFVPTLGLLQWFLSSHAGSEIAGGAAVPRAELLSQLVRTQLIETFDDRQLILGRLLFTIVIVLIAFTLIREWNGRRLREVDAFFLVAMVMLAIELWAPSETPGRAWINQRLSLFLILAPLPWLTPRLPGSAKAALVSLFSIIAIANAGFQLHHFRRESDVVERFLAPLQIVRPGSVLLPLNFRRTTPPATFGVTAHAADHIAIEKGLIDLDNYEPRTGYFPIRYRPGSALPDVPGIEDRPGLVDPASDPAADYVFTWMMPDSAPVAAKLAKDFDLRVSSGNAHLYERRLSKGF